MASLGDSIARRIEFIAELEVLAGSVRGARVLDLGCGRHALWTRAYVARGASVVAVELDPVRCREASQLLAGVAAALGVVRGNGLYLPLRSASVRFVHCAQVLEHVASPAHFIRELARVLVPDGHAYLTAINRFAWRDPHFGVVGVNYLPRALGDWVLRRMGAINPEGQALSEMHYFSRRGFARLCAANGLELVTDLKRRERITKRGQLAGRLADLWGVVRSAAFHVVVRRPRFSS